MRINEAKKYLPFVQALAEGKVVQYKQKNSIVWVDLNSPDNDVDWFNASDGVYREFRIKPEAKLRAWRPEEVPVGALLRDSQELRSMIICADESRFYIGRKSYISNEAVIDSFHFSDALTYIYKLEHSTDQGRTWLPCGVAE